MRAATGNRKRAATWNRMRVFKISFESNPSRLESVDVTFLRMNEARKVLSNTRVIAVQKTRIDGRGAYVDVGEFG